MDQSSATNKYIDLETLQRADHDTLTRLDEKFGRLFEEIQEIKDTTKARLGIVEGKVVLLEQQHNRVSPDDIAKRLLIVEDIQKRFNLTWKLMLGVISFLSTIIGFILSTVLDLKNILAR